MPITKAHEPLPPRPVIITWYGDPGIGKTSLFNTCQTPLLIDGDRGVSRSILRKDTLNIESWDEVLRLEREGAFKGYNTIGLDTPKAILDDFLMSYVVSKDPKLRINKLGAYGAIGEEFKTFTNLRRIDQADLAIICHARKDDDTKRMIPDVTGQSLNLILRISDMIGYYTIQSGRRMLFFEPTETTFGKNVAKIPPVEVPDSTDPAFRTFMSDIFEKVRKAIASQSEEQLEATQKSALYQEQISGCDAPDQLTTLLREVNALPDYLKIPLQKVVSAKAKEKGWVANKETMKYEAPAAPAGEATPPAGQPGGESGKPVDDATPDPASFVTSPDDRYAQFGELGMTLELDGAVGYGLRYKYEDINEWPEAVYMSKVNELNEAKKTFNKNGSKKKVLAGTR